MAYRREVAKQFEPYKEAGQLEYERIDVTPEYLADALKSWSVRGTTSRYNGETDEFHEVVLEDICTVVGGIVVAKYFDPRFDCPSRITTHRAKSVGDIFMLDSGMTLIRPFTQ